MYILACKDLAKLYASGDAAVHAVDGVSMAFEQGNFCAITGASGSGKSTLLHMLGGLEYPTSGQVLYQDKNLYDYNDNQLSILRRRRFGFVFQAYNLVSELTAYENIVLPVLLDGRKPDPAYVDLLVDMLGIGDRLDHLPGALSGGQQQRIAIARALAMNPSLILADEPTGALDAATGSQVMELFHHLHRMGNTILMITHNEALAKETGRILHLYDGVLTGGRHDN